MDRNILKRYFYRNLSRRFGNIPSKIRKKHIAHVKMIIFCDFIIDFAGNSVLLKNKLRGIFI